MCEQWAYNEDIHKLDMCLLDIINKIHWQT